MCRKSVPRKTPIYSKFRKRPVGDIIGFFLHSHVAGPGANSRYTVVGMQFGRMLEVNLQGSPDDKVVVIQPEIYLGDGVTTDPDAPPHSTAVALRLIR